MKKKVYAVAVGRRSGLFTDWPTAEAQVKGFAGAKYRSFSSEHEARAWLANPVYQKKERPAAGKPDPVPTAQGSGTIAVFTDGGCSSNPGPGGFGIVILDGGERREMSGGYRLTTNNRMEMVAAVVALEELRGCSGPLDLYSDSSYLVNGITRGWARKWRDRGWRKADGGAVLNVDLWQRLLLLTDTANVRFHWVKGHAGNEWNERCDTLAVAATRRTDLPVDRHYEETSNNGREFCEQRTF